MFLVSYSNADDQVITHIDTEFTDDTYINYDEIPKLDNEEVFGPDAVRDFYIIMGFGLITLQLNFFGSLYVIYRIYVQWRRGGRTSISLSLRFPFYIALTDAFLSLGYTVNLSYTFVWKLPWSNPMCGIIGASVVTLFTLNMFLVGIIALTTWLRVCKEYYVDFGPYDYKLWTLTTALSVIVVCLSINEVGQQKYWCAGRHHKVIIPIIMFLIILLILLTILICYIKVYFKVHKLDDLLTLNNSTPRRAHIEKRALRKLISYIFTFILQFFENVLLYMLATTTINFGGIGNFFQFVINEGFSSSQTSSQTSSMESSQQINSIEPEETKTTDSNYVREIGDSTIERYRFSLEFGEKFDENIVKNLNNVIVSDDNGDLENDNIMFNDALTVFDSSINSTDVLLNRDDYFYTK
ncbi:8093_t:CDS:2 [Funneliformis caledonium]|uniref:8093_t:CDS:1 n=1 Tax=Funneliformis caledonium TaxID=1117310 RepID=A0A9N9GST5_9GLOM|nr:8093_t:CDS:2 [Funneliformis caledonium]